MLHDAVCVEASVGCKGRGLVCSRDVEDGTLIAEQFADCFVADDLPSTCSYCLSRPTHKELMRCSRCKQIWYCSAVCQKRDWKVHKQECAALVRVAPKVPPTSVRLAARLLAVVGSSAEIQSAVEQLVYHDASSETQMEALTSRVAVLVEYWGRETKTAVPPPLVLLKIACNSFTISDSDLNPVGAGLFAQLAVVNHSCVPNAAVSFQGPIAQLRALRPISKDEEVTIRYVDIAQPCSLRRRELETQYGFVCRCPLCQETPDPLSSITLDGAIVELSEHGLPAHANTPPGTAEQLARAAEVHKDCESASVDTPLQRLRSIAKSAEQVLGHFHWQTFRVLNLLVDRLISEQKWQDALRAASATVPFLDRFLHHDPQHVLQMARLAKLSDVCQEPSARQTVVEALTAAIRVFGESHPVTRELQMMVMSM